jgi:hypothetical protein
LGKTLSLYPFGRYTDLHFPSKSFEYFPSNNS